MLQLNTMLISDISRYLCEAENRISQSEKLATSANRAIIQQKSKSTRSVF